MKRELSTKEVADRLGVKPETVYAYVSRGLLTSRRSATGRGSVFDAKEVEAVGRKHGGRRSASGSPSDTAGITVRTAITSIGADRYFYRGVDAVTLARRHRFEDVADWLWTGMLTPDTHFVTSQAAVTAAHNAVRALPPGRGLLDVLRVATVAASVADPLRFDLTAETVHATARSLIATLVSAIPVQGPDGAAPLDDAGVAPSLWHRLAPDRPAPAALRCLEAALVLLIDHDLAASTFAARVAASARANPYAMVSAALGALEGPLHGAASSQAHRMLTQGLDSGGAATVVAEHLREGRRIPGLGHRLYPREDPRAELLLEMLAGWPDAAAATRMARDIAATAAAHAPLYPNIDMALAVLSVSAGMRPDSGECIFAVARTANVRSGCARAAGTPGRSRRSPCPRRPLGAT
jgi:citrate synthase